MQQPLIGYSIIVLPEVDSSNNYAMQQISDGKAVHGMAYLALQQTNGKGQRGKKWHTGTSQNLALSIVLEPIGVNLNEQFLLHTFITVSLVQWLNAKKDGFSIKWPNDIYFNDRKAAGILIENKVIGTLWKNAVVGIGLNVNQTTFDADLNNAISLQQIMNNKSDLMSLAQELCAELQIKWPLFLQQKEYFLDDYNNQLYKKNQIVSFNKNNEFINATVQSVSSKGTLMVFANEQLEWKHGEVDWVG